MRGCRKQAQTDNFMWELLDLRWTEACKFFKVPCSIPLREAPAVVTDRRQHLARQKRNGKITLTTKSHVYCHTPLDRCMTMEESWIHQGWGMEMKLDDIGNVLPQKTRDLLTAEKELAAAAAAALLPEGEAPPPLKRTRPQRRQPDVPGRSLAGACFCQPDLYLLVVCGCIASEAPGIWEFPPMEPPEMEGWATADYRVSHLVVDPEDVSGLRHACAHAGDESSDDDKDIEEEFEEVPSD